MYERKIAVDIHFCKDTSFYSIISQYNPNPRRIKEVWERKGLGLGNDWYLIHIDLKAISDQPVGKGKKWEIVICLFFSFTISHNAWPRDEETLRGSGIFFPFLSQSLTISKSQKEK